MAGEQGGERMVYFKYHKPLDVASSWDKNDRSSMLHFMPPDLLTRKGGGEGQPIPGRIPTKNLMLQRQQQQMGAYRGKRLFPVGRLDKDSSGLMLVTNDGRLGAASSAWPDCAWPVCVPRLRASHVPHACMRMF